MGKIFVTGHRGASFPKPEQHGVGYMTPNILAEWLGSPVNKQKSNVPIRTKTKHVINTVDSCAPTNQN
jgi:hypothetical protein